MVSSLKAKNLELSTLIMKQKADIEKGIEDKKIIQEELTKTLKELNERESENSKLKEELATTEKYKTKAFTLSEKYESLKKGQSNLQDKYSAVSEELAVAKKQLATLESKLAAASALCEYYKTEYISLKESRVVTDEKRISHLSSDLDATKEALNLEKLKSKELEDTIVKHYCDFTTIQDMFLSKEKELIAIQEIKKALDESVSTLKNKLALCNAQNQLRDQQKSSQEKSKKTSVRRKESSERNEGESSRMSSLRSRENKISYATHFADSDTDTFEPQRKRVQKDTDTFEPQRKRVQKKGSVASLQVKRKVAESTENISPARKFANCVGSTLKAAGTNVVKNMSSPRLTRGKKRLFNTDASDDGNPPPQSDLACEEVEADEIERESGPQSDLPELIETEEKPPRSPTLQEMAATFVLVENENLR